MSVPSIELLVDRWRSSGVTSAVDAASERTGFSDEYVDTAASQPRRARPKVVKDGVWGMIEVDPASLRLLDCPLMQRMRSIRQLGLTHVTYPSAEHTRFIHSLGMYCVVSRFLEVIRRRVPEGSLPTDQHRTWTPDEDGARRLNHAALLHDVGHMPLSHVSESAMQADGPLFLCGPKSVDDLLFDVEDLLGKPLKLAECLSLAIVLSPRFQRFYRTVVHPGAPLSDLHEIAALIAGLEPQTGLSGPASVISGTSIDADKIDYINRDAAACGIPVGVDVSRLFLRSSFLEVTPAGLQRLRSTVAPPATSETIFVVNASGIDSIEEIGQARTMLYHRVYLHQTTRNAERVFAKALHAAATHEGTHALRDALEVWSMTDEHVLAQLASPGSPSEALGKRLRSRILPKRACAFGRKFATPSVALEAVFRLMPPETRKTLHKQMLGTLLEGLRANHLRGAALRELEDDLLREARTLASILEEDLPPEDIEIVNVLPMPNVEPNRGDCIILENEHLLSTAASSVSDEQMEAADIVKSTGYVTTDAAWREIVFLAVRKVLYQRRTTLEPVEFRPHPGAATKVMVDRRIQLDEESVGRKVALDRAKLGRIVRTAARKGHFDACPRLVPLDLPVQAISDVADRLASFGGQGGWSVTPASVKAFLLQFPSPLRRDALALLARIDMLDRAPLSSMIGGELMKIGLGSRRGFVVGLSPDSGGSVRVLLEHELRSTLSGAGWTIVKSIRDVFSDAEPGDVLALVDDNATSGTQLTSQLMAWMDVDKAEWSPDQLSETGIEKAPLADRDKASMRAMHLRVVTAVGTTAAAAALDALAGRLAFPDYGGMAYAREIAASVPPDGALARHLAAVGTSVLAWARHRSVPERLSAADLSICERDALGYRGAGAAMCTAINVPVGTVTALWCPGIHMAEAWMPLLIRRGYMDHLVLS